MMEMDRRTFLRMGITPLVGLVAGMALYPIGGELEISVQKITGRPAGNAVLDGFIKKSCEDQPNPPECVQHFQFTGSEKVLTTVVGPIIEELILRAIPSLVLSKINQEDALGILVSGNGGVLMTKRELVVGAVHNLTLKGIDTETIPAPITLMGFAFWYLQRKFGILANTIAHSTNNTIAVSMMK